MLSNRIEFTGHGENSPIYSFLPVPKSHRILLMGKICLFIPFFPVPTNYLLFFTRLSRYYKKIYNILLYYKNATSSIQRLTRVYKTI